MRVLPFKIQVSRIDANLFLGSIEDAYDAKKLSSLGITHILNMATEIPNFHEGKFEYKKIHGRDVPSFQMHRHFDEVADFIHASMDGGKVFVHCFCGISRSTTAILAYFVKYRGIDPRKGYELIRKKRWIVYPNDGFMRQLMEYFKVKSVDPSSSTGQVPSKNNFTIKRIEPAKLPSIGGCGPERGGRRITRSVNKENILGPNPVNVKGSVPKNKKLQSETRLNCFKY